MISLDDRPGFDRLTAGRNEVAARAGLYITDEYDTDNGFFV